MSNRISKLETDVDKRLSNRLAELVDKRVNPEMKKTRTEEDNRMCNIRSDMTSELEELGVKVNSITDTLQADVSASASDNRHVNSVVRNFPESVNENIEDKINSLIKSHTKVNDVNVSAARRIASNLDSKPGVVIATFTSREDKDNVMKAKNNLKIWLTKRCLFTMIGLKKRGF